ncbi:MAG: hypothetical protein M1812_000621 [Candelaria pacifica]|nr:MAG: hypothetical protein M1812_000621 [Candelaria pacifica]
MVTMRRPRGPGGRFLTCEEIQELYPGIDTTPDISSLSLFNLDLVRLSLNGEFFTIRQPFPFLKLPAELRNQVYRHLLDKITLYPPIGKRSDFRRLSPYRPGHPSPRLETAILATNRHVHDEAAHILYGCQLFHTTVVDCNVGHYSSKCAEPLELLASEYLRRITRISIHIHSRSEESMDRLERGNRKVRAHIAQICVLLTQCKLSEVKVIIWGTQIPSALQANPEVSQGTREVGYGYPDLEPFKALQNVGTVTIHGAVGSEYACALQAIMEGEVTPEGQAMARRNHEERWVPILPKPPSAC